MRAIGLDLSDLSKGIEYKCVFNSWCQESRNQGFSPLLSLFVWICSNSSFSLLECHWIRDFLHSPILPSDHASVCFARLELYDRLYKNNLITFCGIFIRKFHMNFDNFEVIIWNLKIYENRKIRRHQKIPPTMKIRRPLFSPLQILGLWAHVHTTFKERQGHDQQIL